MSKAVILDRDGVINSLIPSHVPFYGGFRSPFTLEEFRHNFFQDKFSMAMKMLLQNDYKVFIATNQPWVSTGHMSNEELEKINSYLKEYGVEDVLVATDKNDNFRYKPHSGMYKEIVRSYDLDQASVWVVGDRWKDIVPGWNLSMKTILCCPESDFFRALDEWPSELDVVSPNFWASDIMQAALIILSGGNYKEILPKSKVMKIFSGIGNK